MNGTIRRFGHNPSSVITQQSTFRILLIRPIVVSHPFLHSSHCLPNQSFLFYSNKLVVLYFVITDEGLCPKRHTVTFKAIGITYSDVITDEGLCPKRLTVAFKAICITYSDVITDEGLCPKRLTVTFKAICITYNKIFM